jgi:tetratricopeptide (TPR) repeat protein
LAIDPGSAEAQAWLAAALAGRVLDELSGDREADIARADELARAAVAASPRSMIAHYAVAQVLRTQGRCREAIPEYEVILALNRNAATTLAAIGRCKLYIGAIAEVIPAQEQAIRLSPRDPNIALWYFRIGQVHQIESRTDEAILWFEKARIANMQLPFPHAHLAAAYALKGELERAAAELAEARKLGGEGSYSSISQLKFGYFEVPALRALNEKTYFAGLRKAGLREE